MILELFKLALSGFWVFIGMFLLTIVLAATIEHLITKIAFVIRGYPKVDEVYCPHIKNLKRALRNIAHARLYPDQKTDFSTFAQDHAQRALDGKEVGVGWSWDMEAQNEEHL